MGKMRYMLKIFANFGTRYSINPQYLHTLPVSYLDLISTFLFTSCISSTFLKENIIIYFYLNFAFNLMT